MSAKSCRSHVLLHFAILSLFLTPHPYPCLWLYWSLPTFYFSNSISVPQVFIRNWQLSFCNLCFHSNICRFMLCLFTFFHPVPIDFLPCERHKSLHAWPLFLEIKITWINRQVAQLFLVIQVKICVPKTNDYIIIFPWAVKEYSFLALLHLTVVYWVSEWLANVFTLIWCAVIKIVVN